MGELIKVDFNPKHKKATKIKDVIFDKVIPIAIVGVSASLIFIVTSALNKSIEESYEQNEPDHAIEDELDQYNIDQYENDESDRTIITDSEGNTWEAPSEEGRSR